MKFHLPTAEIYIPDGINEEEALQRTTHLCVAAHQDDIEIMSAGPILECFQQKDLWFTGVVVTDGRGSPRDDVYKEYNDEEMRVVRFKEQKKAAVVGEYAAQIMLDFPSKIIKDAAKKDPLRDIAAIIKATKPYFIYTHNPADKHDTHVAVCLRTIAAIRSLPKSLRPKKVFGCEVWRDLDWMVDTDKTSFDLSKHENVQAALLGVFDSQIAGGKRYDLASMGRRRANATYFESHGVDQTLGMSFGMDLTPLVEDPAMDVFTFVQAHIQRFEAEVKARLGRIG
jgi:LmbE family N-acetylglucosaminyl deacetylase